jgi:hypothetical protein
MRIANFYFICVTMQVLNGRNNVMQFFLPEKKEYAKLAIPLTGSKGQALRVFEKISTPSLRFG